MPYAKLLVELSKTKEMLETCLHDAQTSQSKDVPFTLDERQAEIWQNARLSAFSRALELLPNIDAHLGAMEPTATSDAQYKHAAEFTAKWAWRDSPNNLVPGLTDQERVSVIKYHPTIKRIAAQQVNREAGDAVDAQMQLFHQLIHGAQPTPAASTATTVEPLVSDKGDTPGVATLRTCLMLVDEQRQVSFTLSPEIGFDGITHLQALQQAEHYVSLPKVFNCLVQWYAKHDEQNHDEQVVYRPEYASLFDAED